MDPNENTAPEGIDLDAMDAAMAGETVPDPLPADPKQFDESEGKTQDLPDGQTDDVVSDDRATPLDDKAKDAEKPDPKKDEAADKQDEAGKDETVEAEIATLGAKGKTAERIRDLSAKVAAAEPLRAELEQIGVKTVEDVQQLVRDANTGLEMVDMVRKTGATQEEYAYALDILSLRAKGRSGDPTAAEEAFRIVGEEYAALAKLLGKPVPGVFDPLDGHDDLREEVENGDITQARALEIANQRNLQAMAEQGRKQQAEKQTQTAALTQGMEQARNDLNALGATLGKEDGERLAHYHGNGTLKGIIEQVKAKFPQNPDLWALQTELAYRRLPPLPAAKPAGTPVRASTPITPSVIPDFKDMTPEQALELALNGG